MRRWATVKGSRRKIGGGQAVKANIRRSNILTRVAAVNTAPIGVTPPPPLVLVESTDSMIPSGCHVHVTLLLSMVDQTTFPSIFDQLATSIKDRAVQYVMTIFTINRARTWTIFTDLSRACALARCYANKIHRFPLTPKLVPQ